MDSDFESLSKGIFVVPFNPETSSSVSGPSRPPQKPLQPIYDATYDKYLSAYKYYEEGCTAEQLDDVADWLERCAAPPLLKQSFPIHRLPVAIIQNISSSLPTQLHELGPQVLTLNGRDILDLTSGVRAVAVGFVGEAALAAKKTGRTGMDEVERWWEKQRSRPTLLLHIQHAQLVPSAVLSELTYILTLRTKLPIRLLLSVPSTSTFLPGWTHIEPSSIDLSVLGSSRGRRRINAVNAILKVATDCSKVPLVLSEEVAEELKKNEDITGGGAAALLKALKWILLHHSFNSPLARAADDEELRAKVKTAVDDLKNGIRSSNVDELLVIHQTPDLSSVLNPAPRISVLQGLSRPSSFIRHHPQPLDVETNKDENNGGVVDESNDGNEFRELKMLFSLWKAAGKSINLWDWLDGFRGAILEEKKGMVKSASGEEEANGHVNGRKRKREKNGINGEVEGVAEDKDENEGEQKEADDENEVENDEEEQARLHATFIRFCEEARMMGLVRAKGKGAGRRGDEVVKGVGMV